MKVEYFMFGDKTNYKWKSLHLQIWLQKLTEIRLNMAADSSINC